MRLGVRPQPQPARRRGVLHALEVPLDARLFDEDAGGPEIGQPHEGECISDRQTECRPDTASTGAAPALAGCVPLPRGGKTVSARTLASLDVAASRDACGRQLPGALMRRWSRGIYADHIDRTRRAESLRPFSGCAVRRLAPSRGPRRAFCARWGGRDAGRPAPALHERGTTPELLCLPHRNPSVVRSRKPGKTAPVSVRPRCPRTTSAKTLRKSVVTARSRPS